MNIQSFLTHPLVYLDLQTEDTILVDQKGSVLLQEPAIFAKDIQTGSLVCWGKEAKRMYQRTGRDVSVFSLMKNGRISDEALLTEALTIWKKSFPDQGVLSFFPQKTAWLTSHRWGQLQKNIVKNACASVGLRSPLFISYAESLEQYIVGKQAHRECIYFIVLGNQASDLYCVSQGKMQFGSKIPWTVAGLEDRIRMYLRVEKGLDVGQQDITTLCLTGVSFDPAKQKNTIIRGKDHVSGKIVSLRVSSKEVYTVCQEYLQRLAVMMKMRMHDISNDLLHDGEQIGVFLSGIGSEIDGIDTYLTGLCEIPIRKVPRPKQAGVLGAIQLVQKA